MKHKKKSIQIKGAINLAKNDLSKVSGGGWIYPFCAGSSGDIFIICDSFALEAAVVVNPDKYTVTYNT